MKKHLLLLMMILSVIGYSQSAEEYFVASANEYMNSKTDKALEVVSEGIDKFPESPKLKALKQKIEEKKEQDPNSEGKEKSNQQEENTDDSDDASPDDSQNQQKSGQQDGRNRGDEGTGNSDEEPQGKSGNDIDEGNPKGGSDLQNQRYDQILKALEKQEQNTQRRLIMGDNKARYGRKQKDW